MRMQVVAKLNLAKLADFFEQEKDVAFVLLFGSYAKNQARANSDVDLAIYLNVEDKIERTKRRFVLIAKLLNVLKKEVDLVVLNDAQDNFLLSDIFTEGKKIFCRNDELYFDFMTKRQHEISDFLTHYYYVNSRENLLKN